MKALAIFLLLVYLLGSESAPIAFFLLILYLAYLVGSLRSASVIGNNGERKVRNKIKSFVRRNKEYISFHNLTLETPDGTTQIDHVLISPYGIVVIETKNYKGWIFGDEKQKMWTQTLYRRKFNFQNPLRQNYKHIKAVQTLLGVRMKQITSIVVFTGKSRFKTVMPYNVLVLRQLIPFIKSYQQQIISIDDLEIYAEKLGNPSYFVPENQNIHIHNVKQNKEQPLCPRCGKPMVIRTVSRGRSAGKKFWGCSGYPSCKATKSI